MTLAVVTKILAISGYPHGHSGRSEDSWDTSVTQDQSDLAKMSLAA